MKKLTKVITLLLAMSLILAGCGSVDKLTEKVDGAKEAIEDAKEFVEDAEDQLGDVIDDASELIDEVDDADDVVSILQGTSPEAIKDFLAIILPARDSFVEGHRTIGFIHKPTHDYINDMYDYVNSLKIVMAQNDYSEFAFNNQDNSHDLQYNHNLAQVGNQYFYTKDSILFKSNKMEEEIATITKLYIYEPDLNQLNYVNTRNNADGTSINIEAQYSVDSSGTLYMVFSSFNTADEVAELIMVSYDGQIVRVGHTTDSIMTELPLDIIANVPNSSDEFFGDRTFTLELIYDGDTMEQKN